MQALTRADLKCALDSAIASVHQCYQNGVPQRIGQANFSTPSSSFQSAQPYPTPPHIYHSLPASPQAHALPPSALANPNQNSEWRLMAPGSSGSKRVTESGQIAVDAVPINLIVPPASRDTPLSERWEVWVNDWEKGDPGRKLFKALKDWEPEWYSGKNRGLFGVTRGRRQMVAMEFNRWVALFVRSCQAD